MFELHAYVTALGRVPFRKWFDDLDETVAARVYNAMSRLQKGNVSNVKPLGRGLLELKIHFGPGVRVYFGMEGRDIIVLLGGGTKQRQDRDIAAARKCWLDYQTRKEKQVWH
jgi:putative addiction module killer protein